MRHDYTQWLIHFVRDRSLNQDTPQEAWESSEVFMVGELDSDASAFSVLKSIIRLGGLLPGHSFRTGRTTIYGGKPVVCASEMPIYSFAMYASSRADPTRVSAYGIALLKSEFFDAGGRPAIYGLSSSGATYIENSYCRRILDPSILPVKEQYRYVAYNPTGTPRIDWSHEREWRWAASDPECHVIWCEDMAGEFGSTPGLPLFQGKQEGGHFSRLCVIVWSRDEAQEIQKILTGFYLSEVNKYDTIFDRKLICSSLIIVLQDVIDAVRTGRDLNAQTIEGLVDAGLVEPIAIREEPEGASKLVSEAFAQAGTAGKQASDLFLTKNPGDHGTCGYAWLVTYEVTDALVQYLLANRLASGPSEGAVRIDIPCQWPTLQSIDHQECVYEAVAKVLTDALGFKVYVHSMLD